MFKCCCFLVVSGPGCITNAVRLFVYGSEVDKGSLEEGGQPSSVPEKEPSQLWRAGQLAFCFCGLQISYLMWGILQERIMAHEYGATDKAPGERFKNSQFLVFMNRILAFAVACLYIIIKKQPPHTGPLFKYSYSSFSNILSSWFQYEALKFVSFPTQVLTKASKVIPVMLMGKLVSKRTYQYYEYLTAVMISLGLSIFLLTGSGEQREHADTVTTFSGVLLLVGYLAFDSFTSNWQGALFSQYKMSSFQMMAGVNMFSVVFTGLTLMEQGGFIEAMGFTMRHSTFSFHVLVLSMCSAMGQLFIFYTIQTFGPVVFTIIMTIRQGLAILLSCIIYHHPVTGGGMFGLVVVFAAMFMRVYFNKQSRKAKPKRPEASESADAAPLVTTSNGKA